MQISEYFVKGRSKAKMFQFKTSDIVRTLKFNSILSLSLLPCDVLNPTVVPFLRRNSVI